MNQQNGSGNTAVASMQTALGIIAAQGALPDVFEAICRYAAEPGRDLRVAFFVLCEGEWVLAAHSAFPHSEGDLRGLKALSLSQALLTAGPAHPGQPFERGWARSLHSGAGELLGMAIVFCNGPALPFGSFAERVESACHLAVVALEKSNLMLEAAFRTDLTPARGRSLPPENPEAPLQQVTRMIAQQRPPEEVLSSLCRQMGPTEAERQVAFFLLRGEVWSIAGKSELTPKVELLLAAIDPGSLSDALLDQGSAGRREERPAGFGWARHLASESGELLGMLVGFADGPNMPVGRYAGRIESVCRLASLAIEQINLVNELTFQARHDATTGLFNRTYYERALASSLERPAGARVALLYANLDRFRSINDVLGLTVGTRLLKDVALRFARSVRESDLLARVGGDEFAVVLLRTESDEEVRNIAARLLRSLDEPFTIDGHELFLTASVGVACSSPGSSPEALEREAYLALHHAKLAGKARVTHYQPGMSATPPERLAIEKRLRTALERNEMLLYYQPQIDLASNRICGAEALLRWRPDGFGLVAPAVFLPVLEETGLIVEYGRWALREACRQGKVWIDRAGIEVRMGVNVSALQLAEASFLEDVRAAVSASGFPADLLELEITESVIIGESGEGAAALGALAHAGIHLALDDFGSGYSCLSYLQRLPFERLKIDQSFVRNIGEGDDCPPLLRDIIRMAENLGMASIAEGVETQRQAELLRRCGCGEGQGYYFSRPVPAEEFAAFWAEYPERFHAAEGASAASPSGAHIPLRRDRRRRMESASA